MNASARFSALLALAPDTLEGIGRHSGDVCVDYTGRKLLRCSSGNLCPHLVLPPDALLCISDAELVRLNTHTALHIAMPN